jgi:hypothetical protein
MDVFWTNLLRLSLQLPMFPHPQDLLASACKILRDNDLMVAAMEKTKTIYPKSITLVSPLDLADACRNGGVVIKRDFSDSTTCTYIPRKQGRPELRFAEVKAKYEETSDLYEGIQCLPFPRWMGQPYIPSLVEKGEFRAFLVGGKFKHAVHTWPKPDGQHGIEAVDTFIPLEVIK